MTPKRKRMAIRHAMQRFGVSERHACHTFGAHRSSIRTPLKLALNEEHLTQDIVRLALKYGRYGYRRITALLRCLVPACDGLF